jgi:hypothetical protein
MKEIKKENKGPKYSEMLMQLVENFDEQLPEELTFEDTLEIGIEAWNLANNKSEWSDTIYQKGIKGHKYADVLDKMVSYKLEHFAEYNNIIVDFSTENDILQVKSQTPQEHFNNVLSRMVNVKPKKK